MNQGRDRMECVEQKMRVQLHAQHLKSGSHQLGGQRRGLQLALATALIIMPALMSYHDHPVNNQRHVAIKEDQLPEHSAEFKDAAVHDRFLATEKPGMNAEVYQ